MERLGADAFTGERLNRSGTWAIAFLADWCPFCRAFEPKFAALEGTGSFEIAKGDLTDENNPLWETFHVDVVPTIVAFRDGAAIFRKDGRLGRGLGTKDLKALTDALPPA
jgi:thioredoxin-like negative regulator of GroEL